MNTYPKTQLEMAAFYESVADRSETVGQYIMENLYLSTPERRDSRMKFANTFITEAQKFRDNAQQLRRR